MSQPPDSASRRIHVPDHVVYREFEAETLLLNLETGQYHGLNDTAGRFLEFLRDADGDPAAAITRLAEFYEADPARVEGDIRTLVEALEARGLLAITPAEQA